VQRTRAAALAVSASIVAGVLGGCGTAATTHAKPEPERDWIVDAGSMIDQMRGDVVRTWATGDNLSSARRALANDSAMFALLLAYIDFGSCRRLLTGLGPPPPRLARVAATIVRACRHLERASVLFTRSVTARDPQALLGASRHALAAAPILYTAGFQLAAARR
jgi:hypothetical protein